MPSVSSSGSVTLVFFSDVVHSVKWPTLKDQVKKKSLIVIQIASELKKTASAAVWYCKVRTRSGEKKEGQINE